MPSTTKNNINTNFSASYITLQSESFKISAENGSLKFFDNSYPSGKSLSSISTIYADVSASYIVLNSTSSLPNERVLTAGTGILLTDNGPGGNLTIDVDNSYTTIRSSSYIPNMLIWEDPSVGSPVYSTSNILRISDKLYAFGGLLTGSGVVTNKIYSASYIENPVFVETGATLPISACGGRTCIIDDKIWMFGYIYGTYGVSGSLILTASVSDPLNWGSTGVNLPERRDSAPLILTSTHAIIVKGYYQPGLVGRNTLLTASLTNLTGWGISTTAYGSNAYECGAAVIDSMIYILGGIGSPTAVFKGSSNSNPINLPYNNTTIVSSQMLPEIYYSGNEIYYFGNNTAHVYSTRIGAENGWIMYSTVLTNATQYVSGNSWVGPDGRYYYIHYTGTAAKIVRSSRSSIYVNLLISSGVDPYIGCQGYYSDGAPVSLSKYVRLGFKPWIYSRTGTI